MKYVVWSALVLAFAAPAWIANSKGGCSDISADGRIGSGPTALASGQKQPCMHRMTHQDISIFVHGTI